MNTPRWRWWLFSMALWLFFRTDWEWPGTLMSWCVLPGWLASPDELASMQRAP